jgi:glycosyltransferase involved in cell wall biosynthesis
MLMDALKGIELGDWKAYFIGPVEEHFKRFIDAYFTENPHLKDKVFFMGNIKNRKEFFSWYDRAKVFCHTSLYESFGLVLAEAAYFGDYIISTRVGAAPDILADGVPGKIIERGDAGGLMKALMGVITGETKTDPSWQVLTSLIHNNFLWEGIVEKLYNSITGLRSI